MTVQSTSKTLVMLQPAVNADFSLGPGYFKLIQWDADPDQIIQKLDLLKNDPGTVCATGEQAIEHLKKLIQ